MLRTKRDLFKTIDRAAACFLLDCRARLQRRRPLVSFTFDDIPLSAAHCGAPILEEAGVLGTFYIAGGLCGRDGPVYQFPNFAALRSLHLSGHEIACHTYSHFDCRHLNQRQIEGEIQRNRDVLSKRIPGLRLRNFAYPYGSVGIRGKWSLMDRFDSLRGTEEGLNETVLDLAQLKAVLLSDARMSLTKLERLLQTCVDRKAWLIFFTHEVTDNPSRMDCSPELLRQSIAIAKEAGCTIAPVRKVIAEYIAK